ncbi:MAG: phosphate ABC transporter substrate-binding protein [Armatimonadota bacterium]
MQRFDRTSVLARLAAFAAVAVLAAGCAGPQQTGGDGEDTGAGKKTITVKGSDTMVILGQRLAERYMGTHPGVTVQVTGGGSGTGIAALQNGTTDIAQSSRPIKDKEKEGVKAKFGKEVVEFVVAKDGLSVYVHESNPVKSLSIPQLKAIYTGKIKNWKEVGGNDAPITLYSRENNSGTYVYFKEHVLEDEDFDPRAQNMPGTASVVNAVSKDKNGIGYGGIAYTKGVRDVPIRKDDTSEPVAPTQETIKSGAYPLARDLYFYTVGEPTGAIKEFIDWTLSEEGQKVVEEVEYIPIL